MSTLRNVRLDAILMLVCGYVVYRKYINFVFHPLLFQIPVCLTLVIPMLFVQERDL